MNDDRETLDRVLGTVVRPEPPPELHARVLREAKAALNRRARRDVWARLWESRPLRAVWAAAVLALLVANAVLPGRRHGGVESAVVPPRPPAQRETNELNAITRLPRIDLGRLPTGEVAAPSHVERPKSAHPQAKTKESAS